MTVISANNRRIIGLFGGTFDPIHRAHLQLAQELADQFCFDEMRLLPCHIPPHRAAPGVGSQQRAHMVQLALDELSGSGPCGLQLDCRELQHEKYSYTIDTLISVREELGEDVSICLCMGMDSLCNINTWHRWRELLDYSHIVVIPRPGYELPDSGPLGLWIESHLGRAESLASAPAGTLLVESCSLMPISATGIRESIARGQSMSERLPQSVWQYIVSEGLYRS